MDDRDARKKHGGVFRVIGVCTREPTGRKHPCERRHHKSMLTELCQQAKWVASQFRKKEQVRVIQTNSVANGTEHHVKRATDSERTLTRGHVNQCRGEDRPDR